MTRWRTRHRGARSDRGAAAVEFAIVLVVLLLIIFGIIDFGRLLYASQAMKSASREGARTAVIRGTDWGPSNLSTTVTYAIKNAGSAAASLSGGSLAMSGVGPNGSASGESVTTELCASAGGAATVTVTTGFRWFTPVGIFSSGINSVSAQTTMRCE